MKKITCVGFHDTGASVIDDLFREFDNVSQGYSNAECRVLHDPDGISDLEFHLIENPHRLKTEIAIERFLKYAKNNKREYQKSFGHDWIPLCEEYITSIVKFKYKGWHEWFIKERSPYDKYNLLIKKGLNRLRPSIFRHPTWYDYFPKEEAYHANPSEKEFLRQTVLFTEKLCNLIPHDEKTEYILIDQMLPCDNTKRYMRYVKDLKTIVVDRDPRDLYLSQKVIYKEHILPKDPHQFCIHYRDIRSRCNYENTDYIMYVNFEDMIYKYDEMVKKVIDFVGISSNNHVNPQKYFNPSKSIKGTKLWERFPGFSDDIKIIENKLADMLHNY